MFTRNILNIPVYVTQYGAKIFSRKICEDFFANSLFNHGFLMLNFLPCFYYIYGMERSIKMLYENPLRKWADIDGAKVKPIFFLKAPFKL